MQRRTMLQTALAVVAWRPFGSRVAAQAPLDDAHLPHVVTLAGAVLPQEIGAAAQRAAADQFLRWVRDYRAGAERDHGYGVTGLRIAPPSPAANYVAELADLDRRAGGDLATLALVEQQRVVSDAIAAAGVKDLPGRPNGGHVATDLMSHYFHSPAANDLAYRRAIGRDACRDLSGSDRRPPVLSGTKGGA
ncbi:MAG: hypothetical protein ABI880_01090 [Acidobacteriota bacterium]